MDHEIEIVERPEIRVIGLGHAGAYDRIGPTFERLGAALGARGLWPEAREFLGLYFGDPRTVAEADLRSMAGIAVRADLAVPEGFEAVVVPAGRYAVLRHRGPYEGLGEAWRWMYAEGLPTSGLETRDAAACEIYRNAPGEVPDAELRVDICVAVA